MLFFYIRYSFKASDAAVKGGNLNIAQFLRSNFEGAYLSHISIDECIEYGDEDLVHWLADQGVVFTEISKEICCRLGKNHISVQH